ncbi:MAG: hypothetical protein ABSD50_02760 [Smithella sp.]
MIICTPPTPIAILVKPRAIPPGMPVAASVVVLLTPTSIVNRPLTVILPVVETTAPIKPP